VRSPGGGLGFCSRARHPLAVGELPTGNVTFMFTDVEGSTRLLHELGPEGYAKALGEHRRIVREAFEAQGGVEVDTQGDAFFVVFRSAPGALRAAADAAQGLADGPIRVRMGVHSGTPHLAEEGYVGVDVHRAARIAACGHGGQVLVSASTAALAAAHGLRDLGEHRLKDFDAPVTLYQLGQESFPPLKTISNTNLPRPASSFVGRQAELDEIVSRLRDGARFMTLTGPGGSGKTRLAIEAAAELVLETKAGVFWVGLAALRDAALVTDTIAQVLGAKDGLADHVGERDLLLLLDNLEQVVDAAPELAVLIETCPNLKLLVTSRELLRVTGELEYPVLPLAAPEAVELFCARARAEPDEAVQDLCRSLDNLPLALELAAARTSVLSPKQILERLSERLDLLKGGRDADPRQQTLRATIEWSHALLSADEQLLFARLGVFSGGGCRLEAAEEVTQADVDTLQSLVDKSLVRHSGERFWMLETIREFATERLDASVGHKAIRGQHAHYYLGLVERTRQRSFDLDSGEAYAQLDAEYENARIALDFFETAAPVNEWFRLIRSLDRFWYSRGLWREGRAYVQRALERRGEATLELQADLLARASILLRGEDPALAAAYAEESVALARQIDGPGRLSEALHQLGASVFAQGDSARATAVLTEAVATARRAGESGADSTVNLADIALAEGEFERAVALSLEALELWPTDYNETDKLIAQFNLASALIHLGRPADARPHLRGSLQYFAGIGYTEITAWCLIAAAAVQATTGEDAVAARLLGAAETMLHEAGASLGPSESRLRDVVLRALESRATDEWRQEGRRMERTVAVRLAFESLD
jgi:predicted ATPase/class 3 adenylate cyclase